MTVHAGKVIPGPAILRVGERDHSDPKFAPDEFVYAPPGTIVAPRPRSMKPTLKNAVKALKKQASKNRPHAAQMGAGVTAQPQFDFSTLLGLPRFLMPPTGGVGRGTPIGVSRPRVSRDRGRGSFAHQPGIVNTATGPLPLRILMNRMLMAREPDILSSGQTNKRTSNAQFGATITPGLDPLQQYLSSLLGATGTLGVDLPAVQLQLMNALGFISPHAFGQTDPEEFRRILTGAIATGLGFPTLQRTGQQFGQAQQLAAQLGLFSPDLLNAQNPQQLSEAVARMFLPGGGMPTFAREQFEQAAKEQAAARTQQGQQFGQTLAENKRQFGETLRENQLAREFNQALTGFRQFGLGAPRPRTGARTATP